MVNAMAATAPLADAVQGDITWFDGQTTRRWRAHLLLAKGVLRIAPDAVGMPRRYMARDVGVSEAALDTPLALNLPDGSTAWVDDTVLAQALDATLRKARQRRRRDTTGLAGLMRAWSQSNMVGRLVRSWPGVVACLLSSIALLVWFDRQGATLAADAAMGVIPHTVDEKLGNVAFATIQKEWLSPSQVAAERQQRLRKRFDDLVLAARIDRDVDLRFFRMKSGSGGFNAFALPNGTIVVLDDMTEGLSDDELMMVFSHELGHVVHRHGLRAAVRSLGLLSVASVAIGDFSSVAATVISSLQTFHYSRAAEREADHFGRDLARLAGLPPGTEEAVWKKLMQQQGGDADDLPDWLSTHPSTDERLRAAREAGGSR